MPTAYTALLGLALPVTGELSGTWGDVVSDGITSLLDTAVAGVTTLTTDADVTLSTTTGAANQARQAIINCTGARSVLRTITAPAASKEYVVINGTTGGFSVKIVGVGPTAGITVLAGTQALVAWNGSDFVQVGVALSGISGLGTGVATALAVNNNTAGGYSPIDGTAALTNKTYNGNTFTAGTGVLTIAASKTLTANNSITLAGTDATTMTFPTTSATIARTDAANTFTGTQTFDTPIASASMAAATSTVGGRVPTPPNNTTTFLRGDATFAEVPASAPTVVRSARTSNTVLAVADQGTLIDITSGTFTQTFTAAATLGSGWWCYIRNAGTGYITLDPSGSETIDGLTTFIMYPKEMRLVQCSGSAFISVVITPFRLVTHTTFTFTQPPGYAANFLDLIGGGGNGGEGPVGGGEYSNGRGGSGGGRFYNKVPVGADGASITVTVGAAVGTTSFGTVGYAEGGTTGASMSGGSASTGAYGGRTTGASGNYASAQTLIIQTYPGAISRQVGMSPTSPNAWQNPQNTSTAINTEWTGGGGGTGTYGGGGGFSSLYAPGGGGGGGTNATAGTGGTTGDVGGSGGDGSFYFQASNGGVAGIGNGATGGGSVGSDTSIGGGGAAGASNFVGGNGGFPGGGGGGGGKNVGAGARAGGTGAAGRAAIQGIL